MTTIATPEISRPDKDQYGIDIARVIATRATCLRKRVGAVITDRRNNVLGTGYNGSPRGLSHCIDPGVGCLIKVINGRESCVRTIHAESNVLDLVGHRAEGGSIYITVTPCYECIKRIVNAGIKRVIFKEWYDSQNTDMVIDLLGEANIAWRHMDAELRQNQS